MSIQWCRKLPKRELRGEYEQSDEYRDEYLVRTSSPGESLGAMVAATGVAYRDPHPENPDCEMLSFSVSPAGDSGLLYRVTLTYRVPPPEDNNDQPPQEGAVKAPQWSGGSSVVTVPVLKHYEEGNDPEQMKPIANSAGDPIHGLECEAAEHRLTLTAFVSSHETWMGASRMYTNAINSDTWNGCAPRTWKCQGCSAKLGNAKIGGANVVFWEVTWEFVYRADTWLTRTWDVGFYERCDVNKVPSASGDERKIIYTVEKKPTKTPVALSGGIAKQPGQEPDELSFRCYRQYDFGEVFGEVYTPQQANT